MRARLSFTNQYKKMPFKLNPTTIVSVEKTHYNKLSDEFIRQDTETVEGDFYHLPQSTLLLIRLDSNGHKWQTLRYWTPDREKYYKRLVGQYVTIEVIKAVGESKGGEQLTI